MTLSKEEQWLLEEKYAGQESPAFFVDLERLSVGEPLAYVIGFVDFLGCRIDLSERPLIPRPETEYWTEKIVTSCKSQVAGEQNKTIRILDMFAGSGCIGIALLKHLPNATVDFADIDERCLLQIRKNLALNGIAPERYRVFRSDVFEGVPKGSTYDLITANPPYIDPAESDARVAESVKNFEPTRALFAGDKGLAYISRVLAIAKQFLAPGGMLYLEHDDMQKAAISEILHTYEYANVSFHKDQFGHWRFVRCG